MAKYTCHTCGAKAEKPWDVCSPVADEGDTSAKKKAENKKGKQALGRYICAGCGNLGTDPNSMCYPENI